MGHNTCITWPECDFWIQLPFLTWPWPWLWPWPWVWPWPTSSRGIQLIKMIRNAVQTLLSMQGYDALEKLGHGCIILIVTSPWRHFIRDWNQILTQHPPSIHLYRYACASFVLLCLRVTEILRGKKGAKICPPSGWRVTWTCLLSNNRYNLQSFNKCIHRYRRVSGLINVWCHSSLMTFSSKS